MPKFTSIFKRVEQKYIISDEQRKILENRIMPYIRPDEYGKSTISSVYLDTPDFRIIRSSIDADCYKEKIRIRAYGKVSPDGTVFLEIKKKYKGVVFKRRETMTLNQAVGFVSSGKMPFDSQINREIEYALNFYSLPEPVATICCEREAFFVRDDPDLRITFDTGIRYRTDDLLPSGEAYGSPLLPDGMIIFEYKTNSCMPLWLVNALDEIGAFPKSFSKYGNAYKNIRYTKEYDQ